jgi:hypothetical protein
MAYMAHMAYAVAADNMYTVVTQAQSQKHSGDPLVLWIRRLIAVICLPFRWALSFDVVTSGYLQQVQV